jgi:hypothetical protein
VFNNKHELTGIELLPIVLGFGNNRTHRGRPLPASSDAAASILDRVAELSSSFGTKVAQLDGKGVVAVHERANAAAR